MVLAGMALLAACASVPQGPASGGTSLAAALERGDLDGARRLLEGSTDGAAGGPGSPGPDWARLGVALAQEQRWEEAASAFETSLAARPGEAPVQFDLAVAYRHLGRYAAARDSYLQAAALDPGDLDILYNLGILYELYLNQPERALEAYARYVAGGGPEAGRVRPWIDALERRRRDDGGPDR
jgi:tetratricopeptide (TPR) repeat protein